MRDGVVVLCGVTVMLWIDVIVTVEDVLDGLMEDVLDGLMEDVLDGLMEDVLDGFMEDVLEGFMEDVLDGLMEDVLDGLMEDVLDGFMEDVLNGLMEDVLDGLIEDELDGLMEEIVVIIDGVKKWDGTKVILEAVEVEVIIVVDLAFVDLPVDNQSICAEVSGHGIKATKECKLKSN